MTDKNTSAGGEPVGSVGEEAAKLFSALSGVAKEHLGSEQGVSKDAPKAGKDSAFSAGSLTDSITDSLHNINAHVATGGEDCRYCPVCQAIHVVRETSPEVKAHLLSAATSLLQAVAGALATQTTSRQPGEPVEKIDLDGGTGPDGDTGWQDES